MNTQGVSVGNGPKLALSRVEAAKALGLSTVTLDRLTERGLLRPSRATRRPLFPVWELERFLRESSQVIMLAKGGVG
ncbi:MAG: helix-turn-helix domain-containing protein [Terrimicrobiaceae bacterium]